MPVYTESVGVVTHAVRRHVCSVAGCDKYETWSEIVFATYGYKNVERWSPGDSCEVQLGTSPIWPHPRYFPYAELNGNDWIGPHSAAAGELNSEGKQKHLTAFCRFTLYGYPEVDEISAGLPERKLSLLIWVWPNGYVQRVVRDWGGDLSE